MTLTGPEKKALSTHRLEKAKRMLDDARLLFKEGRWESTLNRSYYAADASDALKHAEQFIGAIGEIASNLQKQLPEK